MSICPKCSKEGYLVQEKIRPSKSKPRMERRKLDWSTMKPVSYFYKPYSQSRTRHHYWSFVHNIKRGGKWTITKCYIGIKHKEKDCNCNYCKGF